MFGQEYCFVYIRSFKSMYKCRHTASRTLEILSFNYQLVLEASTSMKNGKVTFPSNGVSGGVKGTSTGAA